MSAPLRAPHPSPELTAPATATQPAERRLRRMIVLLVALVVLSGADSVSVFMRSTLVPLVTPNEVRGRVGAVENVFIGASNQLGEFESGALAALITPAVNAIQPGVADRLDAAVSINASHAAAEIFVRSPPLRARVLAGKLKIVAARYDLDDGKVTPAKSEIA